MKNLYDNEARNIAITGLVLMLMYAAGVIAMLVFVAYLVRWVLMSVL